MIPEMRSEKENTAPALSANRSAQERFFDLALHALVQGNTAAGEQFTEYTELSSISASLATLWLKSKIKTGSKIKLSLEVPKTLILENPLKLFVSGKVVGIEEGANLQKKLVSVELEKNFKIQPVRA